MKYGTPIGDPIEEGGGKMVFWVIVCIDSYLYTEKKIATPLYMGVGVKQKTQSKNGTRSNRDPKYDMYDTLLDVKFTLHQQHA